MKDRRQQEQGRKNLCWLLQGTAGVYHADDLTSADQVIPG